MTVIHLGPRILVNDAPVDIADSVWLGIQNNLLEHTWLDFSLFSIGQWGRSFAKVDHLSVRGMIRSVSQNNLLINLIPPMA